MSDSSADDLTAAITRLREAQSRRSRVMHSRVVQVARLSRDGLKQMRSGAVILLRATQMLLRGPSNSRNQILFGMEWTKEHAVDPEHHYEVRLELRAPAEKARSALLSIEYVDAGGGTIAWEERQCFLSSNWGFVRYLEASPDGAETSAAIDPPAGAALTRLRLVGWITDAALEIASCEIVETGPSLKRQRSELVQLLEDPEVALKDVAIVLSGVRGETEVVLEHAEAGERVLHFHSGGTRLSETSDGVSRLSMDLFNEQYHAIASLGASASNRTLCIGRADYYSVLQANYFIYSGWTVSFLPAAANAGDLRTRYLTQLTECNDPKERGAGLG
jgi:hypothetical protein